MASPQLLSFLVLLLATTWLATAFTPHFSLLNLRCSEDGLQLSNPPAPKLPRSTATQHHISTVPHAPDQQFSSRRSFLQAITLTPVALSICAARPSVAADAKSDALAKQMAVVKFTKTIEEATDKAFKFEKKGKFAEAEAQWNIVVDTYQKGGDGVVLGPQAYYRLGKSLALRGDTRARLGQQSKSEKPFLNALTDYKKAQELSPSYETTIKIGTVYTALGKYQEAIKAYDEVLAAGISNEVRGRAYNNRALAKGRTGDWQGACEDYTEAVSATKGTTEALTNLALAKFETGDIKGSLTMLRQQSAEMPLGPIEGAEDVPAALAAAEFAAGEVDQAKSDLRKVQDLRFKDIRYVKEGRFWPPKLVESLKGLIDEMTSEVMPTPPTTK